MSRRAKEILKKNTFPGLKAAGLSLLMCIYAVCVNQKNGTTKSEPLCVFSKVRRAVIAQPQLGDLNAV